jgi:amylosucrase
MHTCALERDQELVRLDQEREQNPEWFRGNDMLGMMLYIDNFAGNLAGVKKKLDYLSSCNVNCIHLMPFLESPKGRSDGGYAVADFRKVQPELGTMEELADLAKACHKRKINLCMDFVMNHTSEDHEWAKKAKEGDGEYISSTAIRPYRSSMTGLYRRYFPLRRRVILLIWRKWDIM